MKAALNKTFTLVILAGVSTGTTARRLTSWFGWDDDDHSCKGTPISLKFENIQGCPDDELNVCPSGWTCTGAASIYGGPSFGTQAVSTIITGRNGYPVYNTQGFQYFELGSDDTKGTATSNVFILPENTNTVGFLRAGGADASTNSGFAVYDATDDSRICAKGIGDDTDTFFRNACDVTGYGGKKVYMFVSDCATGGWAKTYIDDIRFFNGATEIYGEDIIHSCESPLPYLNTHPGSPKDYSCTNIPPSSLEFEDFEGEEVEGEELEGEEVEGEELEGEDLSGEV